MNIRNRVIETYIPGYSTMKETYIEGGLFSSGRWEDKKFYVPSRNETKTVMEYLNPETTEWEPIPETHEYITIDRPTKSE